MSRRRRELRLEVEGNWPQLTNILVCYFHEDRNVTTGTISETYDVIIKDYPLEYRQLFLKEWRSFMDTAGWKSGLVSYVQDGFGVNQVFDNDEDARKFLNAIYDAMIVSVRKETEGNWKP